MNNITIPEISRNDTRCVDWFVKLNNCFRNMASCVIARQVISETRYQNQERWSYESSLWHPQKKWGGGGVTGPFSSNFKALFGQIIRSSTFKTFVINLSHESSWTMNSHCYVIPCVLFPGPYKLQFMAISFELSWKLNLFESIIEVFS